MERGRRKMIKGRRKMRNVREIGLLTKAEDFFNFLLFIFRKPLKLVMGLPKWTFRAGKG